MITKIYRASGYSDNKHSKEIRDYKITSFDIEKETPKYWWTTDGKRIHKRITTNSRYFEQLAQANHFLRAVIDENYNTIAHSCMVVLNLSQKNFAVFSDELIVVTFQAESYSWDVYPIIKETDNYWYIEKKGRPFLAKVLPERENKIKRWCSQELEPLQYKVLEHARMRLAFLRERQIATLKFAKEYKGEFIGLDNLSSQEGVREKL